MDIAGASCFNSLDTFDTAAGPMCYLDLAGVMSWATSVLAGPDPSEGQPSVVMDCLKPFFGTVAGPLTRNTGTLRRAQTRTCIQWI